MKRYCALIILTFSIFASKIYAETKEVEIIDKNSIRIVVTFSYQDLQNILEDYLESKGCELPYNVKIRISEQHQFGNNYYEIRSGTIEKIKLTYEQQAVITIKPILKAVCSENCDHHDGKVYYK